MAFGIFATQIEWTETNLNQKDIMVYKFPLKDNGRVTFKRSKLIVRESQEAVFVHKGQICDIFPAGTYDLETDILPILSKLAGWRYGFRTPITVDIYFVSVKQFTDNKWGTTNPIIVKDPSFGPVRVRGYGTYSFKVSDVGVFLKELFGTTPLYTRSEITDWLKSMIVSSMNDAIGESKLSIMDLAGNTLEFNEIIKRKIQDKFNDVGLSLVNMFIENISVPQEVEKAIDERSKYGVLGDSTDVMMKVAAAEALKDAAKNEGAGGAFASMGIGAGAGFGLGSVFADAMKPSNNQQTQNANGGATKTCPKCNATIKATAKFCPECGEKLGGQKHCVECGAQIKASAKFCPECGAKQ